MASEKIQLTNIDKEVVVIRTGDDWDKIKLLDGVFLTVNKEVKPFTYKLSFRGSSFTGSPEEFAGIYLMIQSLADIYALA